MSVSTRPEHVRQWWGPNHFTVPFCNIDLRPGGVFHLAMRSPDGKDYWCNGFYREIAPPERLEVVEPGRYGMSAEWPLETLISAMMRQSFGRLAQFLERSAP
ncbi:MAG TPA: SRPBCC domain-containing protein [Bryobacteraceae bacterium]|nr:SRPBCC domain-containing protein [Bryobacteraceae bacterium]